MLKNKKILLSIIVAFLLTICAIPVFAEYVAGRVTSLDIQRVGDVVYLNGKTSGFTSTMRVIIKVLDDKGNLQFFDEVPVSNSSFSDFFEPMDIQDDTYLNIIVSGDLAYSERFYYSSSYKNEDENFEYNILKQLQDYKYYKDDNSKYAMIFVITIEQNSTSWNVVLEGTNFVKGDTLWNGKNENNWNSYLYNIYSLAKNISGKNINVVVYDKAGTQVATYPTVIGGGSDSGSSNPSSGDITSVISKIGQTGSYSSNGNTLSFNSSLLDGSTNRYIKVKFVGNFSKEDDVWKNSSIVDLENFSKSIALKLKDSYNADFDFYFYDKDNKALGAYSYYYYQSASTGEVIGENSGENGLSESSPSNPITVTPTPSGQTVTDDTSSSGDLVGDDSFATWNPYRDDKGVYTLNLMIYNGNSGVVDWALDSEGYEGATYKYNYSLSDYDKVASTINSLRNDTKKVIVVRGDTLGSNINFTVPANVVQLLRDNNVTLVLDSSYVKVESDFGSLNAAGDYVVSVNETISMMANKATNAYNIDIKVSGVDAVNSFGTKSKVALHYDSDTTSSVRDLRFVNIYQNNSTRLNTTVKESLKSFIANYYGSGIYCAKEDNIIFNDSNFYDNTYKRYAEIVVSRGIMDGSGGAFNPKFTLTRGEFSNYLARKLGANSYTNYFNGLNGHTFANAINGLYEMNVTPPNWNKDISPDKKITIEEMIYMTVRAYEINSLNDRAYGSALYYQDKEDISVWAKNKVAIAAKLGFIPEDGLLYPTENATREDAAEILFKLMNAEGLFR